MPPRDWTEPGRASAPPCMHACVEFCTSKAHLFALYPTQLALAKWADIGLKVAKYIGPISAADDGPTNFCNSGPMSYRCRGDIGAKIGPILVQLWPTVIKVYSKILTYFSV